MAQNTDRKPQTSIRGRATRMLLSKESRRKYAGLFVVTAMAVVLAVAAILHQNGIALTHEEQVLDCQVAGVVAHTHDQSCYEADGSLVCPLPEIEYHVHDDSCYTETSTLTCGLEESDEHIHDDSCYTVERELTCGKEEVAEEHVHGPGCFTTVTVVDEEAAVAEDEALDEPEPQITDDMPYQVFDGELKQVDGDGNEHVAMCVRVEAPEGAFPAGTTMEIELVNKDDIEGAVTQAVAEHTEAKITDIQTVDITFRNAEGEKIEPATQIMVQVTSGLIAKNEKPLIVHVNNDGEGEVVETLDEDQLAERDLQKVDDQLTFDADDFSSYSVVITSIEQTLAAKEGNNYTVTVDCPETAGIPQGAELAVEEIAEDTDDYKAYLEQANEALENEASFARFFDITITKDGEPVQPAEPVSVRIELASATTEADGLEYSAIHFTDDGQEVIPAEGSVEEDDTVVMFEAESFSVYAIVYTVDLHYEVDGETYEFSLPGGERIALSDVVEVLGILEGTNFDNTEAFLAEVANVEFSDSELVRVAKNAEGDDWTLESLEAFDTEESLTITMKTGDVVTVKVTDDQASASSIDLTDMLQSVTLLDSDGNPVEEDTWHILPGTLYTLRLSFAETSGDGNKQFADDATPMTYKLPDGVCLSRDSYTGSFNVSLGDQGTVDNNTFSYDPETNTITVIWNTEDPDFGTMESMGGVEFHLDLTALITIPENKEIHFSSTVTASIDEYHLAEITKTGSYDENTGKITYTLTVTSTGESSDVVITDNLQGALLRYNHDAQWTSNKTRTDNPSISPVDTDDGGFKLTFPAMESGEVITITYTADVDFSDDTSANWDVYNNVYSRQHCLVAKEEATKNIATLTATDNPNQEAEWKFDNIYKESIDKTGSWETTADENVRKIHWTSVINKEATVSYAGKTVTDRISDAVSDITNYDTSKPITITVRDKAGNVIRTDTVHWNDSGLTYSNDTNGTTWSYTIPGDDGNYQYTFEYDTLVDVTGLGYNPTIQNYISVNSHGRYGSVQVPAGTASFGLAKEVNKRNGKDQVFGDYVEWKITITVPAIGAVEAHLDDEFPRLNASGKGLGMLYDSLCTGDPDFGEGKGFEIEGLADGEDYTWELADKQYSWGIAKLIRFTFYQDEEHYTPGFKGTGNERTITITLRTTNNKDWLDNYPDYGATSNQAEHKNFAKLYTNGSSSSIDDEDKARPQYCRPLKNGNYAGTAIVGGVEYPIYHYQVVFQNVKDILDAQDPSEKVSQVWKNGISYDRNWFEAVDRFDTSVFRYLDAWDENDLSQDAAKCSTMT